MAIVDAQDRFIWASVGFPGNSHDSIIFQSTDLWHNITEKNITPSISQVIEGTEVYPTILGDSAFPFRVWLSLDQGILLIYDITLHHCIFFRHYIQYHEINTVMMRIAIL